MTPLTKIIVEDVESNIGKIDFERLNNKSILITGATGLIGSYLLAYLYKLKSSKQYKIRVNIVIHNDLPEYISFLVKDLKCSIYQGDISDIQFLNTLPKSDFIIHAAGYGQPGKVLEDPIKTIKINCSATLELFKYLNSGGTFLFLSSSEVYSGLINPPFNESQIGNTPTDHPRACYIGGKVIGEIICNEFRKMGINAKSARVSLAYGPGTKKHDKRVLNNFVEKAINDGRIDLLDRGQAKRTYCYITDAIELLWDILLFGKEAIYNVGGNSRITIAELAKLIAEEANVDFYLSQNPSNPSGAPEDVYLDLTRVREEFGKVDFVTLDKGIKNTIDWQRKLYNKP